MSQGRSQCSTCARWRPFDPSGRNVCDAYPGGIPEDIFRGVLDHREPQEGDGGLLWVSDGRPHPDDS